MLGICVVVVMQEAQAVLHCRCSAMQCNAMQNLRKINVSVVLGCPAEMLLAVAMQQVRAAANTSLDRCKLQWLLAC